VYELFIYGDENREYLVAVITPEKDLFLDVYNNLGIEGDVNDNLNHKLIIEYFLQELWKIGLKNDLKPY